MTKHRYTQSKPTVPDSKTTEASVDTDGANSSGGKFTSEESEQKVVEVDTNEILIALLDQFKRINSVLEKQSQAQIQQAATLMQLTDGIKAINDRLKKPSFV